LLEQLKLLIKIQLLEDKKSQLVRNREETPKKVSELEGEYNRIEGDYLLKKTEYEHVLKMRKSIEQEIKDLESKSTRSKQRMNEVKNNKEYQALLKEIEDVKKEITQREDSILELMDKIDSLGKAVKESENELEKHKQRLQEDREKLLVESSRVNEQLAVIEGRQQEVRAGVDPDLLKRCDFLLERGRGSAVAAVLNGTCQVCHMNIPPQKYIELQRDTAILQCPHCHRFIYWPEHESYKAIPEELNGD
jgi:predicted  nucleic acid-binding Zn-ribbon protein